MRRIYYCFTFLAISLISCKSEDKKDATNTLNESTVWGVDFLDEFDTFNPDHWQDQRIWVNNETHCYVPNGEFGTREVSNGTLKLKVVRLDTVYPCDNLDKFGIQHPDTKYVAGRIASKNKKEFVKGKWTARLKLSSSG